MSRTPRKTSAQRLAATCVEGFVGIEIFSIYPMIFKTQEDHLTYFQAYGFSCPEPQHNFVAYAGYGENDKGIRAYFAVLPDGISCGVWVHEASHLVDFIFDHLGLPTKLGNTELRAYMIEHIFNEICSIKERTCLQHPGSSWAGSHRNPTCSPTTG